MAENDFVVISRDIKGANILVTEPGTVKLADFGASATLKVPCSVSVFPFSLLAMFCLFCFADCDKCDSEAQDCARDSLLDGP